MISKEVRYALIMKRVQDHYDEALQYFPEEQIAGEPYKDCLIPSKELRKLIMDYKMLNIFDLEHARVEAKQYLDMVVELADEFCSKYIDYEEVWIRELLEDVSYNIMRISVEKELLK